MFNIFSQNRKRDMAIQFVDILTSNEDGLFYHEADNSISSACIFAPLAGWSNHTINALSTILDSTVPAGTIMQFINMGSPYIDRTLTDYVSSRKGVIGDDSVKTAQYAVKDRASYIQKGARNKLISSSNVRVLESLCIWTIKVPLKTKNPFNGNEKTDKSFFSESSEFLDLRTQILAQMKVAGIDATVMDSSQLIALYRHYFAMYDRWDFNLDENTLLNEQIFPPGSKISWDKQGQNTVHMSGFSESGENLNAGMLVIDRYPGKDHPHHFSQMIKMLGNPQGDGPQIGMPYTLTTTIHFPEQAEKTTKIRTSHAISEKQSNALMLKWSPRLRRKLHGFEVIAQNMLEGGNIVEATTTLCVYHASKREIRKSLATMEAYYKTLGFVMRRERYIPAISFFNQLPANASVDSIQKTYRFKTMSGKHAAHLLPIFDEWQGYGNELLLTTRLGRLFQYSLYHKNNNNYNWSMLASSGAGKSFFVQRLTQDLLSVGTKIWTIDTGSSYLASAQIAGAQIIDFNLDSDICLNPFTKISDINREMELLLPILAKMAKPLEGFNDAQRAICEEAVRSVFMAKGNRAALDDVIQFLNTQMGEMAAIQRELGLLLSAFGSTGSMGRWFSGTNNLRTEADWTVLELSGLTTNKHLCDVVLMMISTSIAQEMFTARDGRKRMLIVEEGGDRITDPGFAEFVAKLYAKVRKEDGSVGTVVQNFDQMYATPYGSTIMASAGTQFFMQQSAESISNAINQKWLIVNAYTENLIRSVHTAKGQYSEVCIRNGESAGIARLIETPFNKVLFSTEGELFKKLQAKVRAGEDVTSLVQEEATKQYLSN